MEAVNWDPLDPWPDDEEIEGELGEEEEGK
jgi:hypothetical protein